MRIRQLVRSSSPVVIKFFPPEWILPRCKLSNRRIHFPSGTHGYNITFEKIYNFRVPTIAAVSGYALAGGFDLAICCDFRIVSNTAKFGQLEVDVHLSPGIDRLWRIVGLSRAKYLGMTCEIIDAQEAYRIGLADKVVKVAELQKEAQALAAKFVAKPREAWKRLNNPISMLSIWTTKRR